MTCPFLRKMNVKYCGLYRLKMLPLGLSDPASERCVGPDYKTCALAREHHPDRLDEEHCPSLSVADVHFCAVAPVRKLVPCNRTIVSRCTDGGHEHCDLYLSMSEPSEAPPAGAADEAPLPPDRALATNHMWLERGTGRTCHVGVDAFFVHALGRIDEIVYPRRREGSRPAVRFRVSGVDLDLVFPNRLDGVEINPHLVVDPAAVLNDPYGRGWLFAAEALPPSDPSGDALEQGLLRGDAARRWLNDELDRLAVFTHDHAPCPPLDATPVCQDGGRCGGHLADVLDRRALARLHAEFFSLRRGRTWS
jgi:glycine cleavage system H lipoate-binding protein